MKKLLIIFAMTVFLPTYSSALSCIEIGTNIGEGSRGQAVTSLQNFLIQKGLLTTEASGFFGPMTTSAVLKYQDSVGLPDSGLVSEETRATIKNDSCNPSQAPSVSNTPTVPVTLSTPIVITAKMPAVNNTTVATSTTSTTSTTTVVSAVIQTTPTPTPNPTPIVVTIPQSSPETTVTLSTGVVVPVKNVSSMNECLDLKSDLMRRSESGNVLSLQKFLLKEGLLMVAPNSYFGPSTLDALKEYQRNIGITDSGIANETTRAAIRERTCDAKTSSTVQLKPVTISTPSIPQNKVTTPAETTVPTSTGVVVPVKDVSSTSECINLGTNVSRGDENADVLSLQKFLLKRGILTVAPNSYFGPSTLTAVKKYQLSVGLLDSGIVSEQTRAAIKKDSCTGSTSPLTNTPVTTGNTSIKVVTPPTTVPKATTTTTISVSTTTKITQVTPVVVISTSSPAGLNLQRQKDVITLLSAMNSYYKDSRGTYPVAVIMTSSTELCSAGITQCNNLAEVSSFLVPNYLSAIPRDPTIKTALSSTSPETGYRILRDINNQITITAPLATGGVPILARCDFNGGCRIETTVEEKKLLIDSIYSPIFISGGVLDSSLVIKGEGFTAASNTVSIVLKSTTKTYVLGDFPSTTGTSINATSSFTVSKLPCGPSCLEIPPAGDYDVIVKNKNGTSNTGFFAMKSITANSITNVGDVSLKPKTTHMKLGSITLSSGAPVTLKTLKLVLTGTTSLVSKVDTFTITDTVNDKVTNGGPNFTLPADTITNNQTKIYDLYANIADIDNSYAGRISIAGVFTVTDYAKRVITVPIPEFLISISY